MTRTQIARAKAHRARLNRPGATSSTRPLGSVGTDLRARVTSTPLRTVRKSRAAKLTGTQRNSIGRTSEWARSPYAPRGGWR